MSEMCKKRSRPSIIDKMLSLGLVEDRAQLYKKRARKSGAAGRSRRKRGSDDSEDEGINFSSSIRRNVKFSDCRNQISDVSPHG